MINWLRGVGREWGLLALIALGCVALASLQYHWASEVSQAETARLEDAVRGGLDELVRAFDSEMTRSAFEYLPTIEQLDSQGWRAAHRDRALQALARLEHPIFRRVAVAVPQPKGEIFLHEINRETGELTPIEWPADWRPLRNQFLDRIKGVAMRGPLVDPASALLEVPIFDDSEDRRREREWMVYEVDLDYVKTVWLPSLAKTYLGSGTGGDFNLLIHARDNQSQLIYGSAAAAPDSEPDAAAHLFPLQLGRIGRRRPGPPPRPENPGRWIAQASHRTGSIHLAVRRSKQRNLGIAFALLAMIGAAGSMLVRYSKRARQLADMQFNFVAGVSHELRTPLTMIRGAGHNLLTGIVAEPAQRENYLKLIVRNADQLTEMVEQLLSYAAIKKQTSLGSAEAGLLRSPVDITQALSEALDSAGAELQDSGSTIDLQAPPGLPLVQGDPGAIRRIFQNLIANAARHGGGGPIEVTASTSGGFVEVRVSDSGPGIPPEELSQVFDPFFRGERARASRIRGTGLGLSLVRDSISLMGGSVSVQSQPNSGTTFTVTFPVIKQA
jgi:signal transduction histidine kinase